MGGKQTVSDGIGAGRSIKAARFATENQSETLLKLLIRAQAVTLSLFISTMHVLWKNPPKTV